MKQLIRTAIVLAAFSTPVIAAPIDPLALYTFENGLLVDDSGNGNTGTNEGGVSLAAGASFDGSTAAEFTATTGLSGIDTGIDINRAAITSLTMGGWFNLSSTASDPGGKVLSHDNGGFDRTLGIDFRGNDAGKGFAAFTGRSVADAPGTAATDVWTHLAVVYAGTSSKLYVNGVVAETFIEMTSLTDSVFNLFIGTNPGFNEDFVGFADDVFVYGRALSDNDIDDIFVNGFPVPAVPLPAGLPLLLAGLGTFAFLRRKSS